MPNFDIPTPKVNAFNKKLKSVSSLEKDFDVATPIVDSYNYFSQETNKLKSYAQPSNPVITTDSSTVNHFLAKMENWLFCPPSSNLWTIKIEPDEPLEITGFRYF